MPKAVHRSSLPQLPHWPPQPSLPHTRLVQSGRQHVWSSMHTWPGGQSPPREGPEQKPPHRSGPQFLPEQPGLQPHAAAVFTWITYSHVEFSLTDRMSSSLTGRKGSQFMTKVAVRS